MELEEEDGSPAVCPSCRTEMRRISAEPETPPAESPPPSLSAGPVPGSGLRVARPVAPAPGAKRRIRLRRQPIPQSAAASPEETADFAPPPAAPEDAAAAARLLEEARAQAEAILQEARERARKESEALRTELAQQIQEEVLRNARTQAEVILEEARRRADQEAEAARKEAEKALVAEAERLAAEARQEAGRIREEAEREAERIRKKAEKAVAQVREEAIEQARSEAERIREEARLAAKEERKRAREDAAREKERILEEARERAAEEARRVREQAEQEIREAREAAVKAAEEAADGEPEQTPAAADAASGSETAPPSGSNGADLAARKAEIAIETKREARRITLTVLGGAAFALYLVYVLTALHPGTFGKVVTILFFLGDLAVLALVARRVFEYWLEGKEATERHRKRMAQLAGEKTGASPAGARAELARRALAARKSKAARPPTVKRSGRPTPGKKKAVAKDADRTKSARVVDAPEREAGGKTSGDSPRAASSGEAEEHPDPDARVSGDGPRKSKTAEKQD